MQPAVINLYCNPLSTERETIFVRSGKRFIDFLIERFPNGFKYKTLVFLNGIELKVDFFDVVLEDDDIVDISIIPEGGTGASRGSGSDDYSVERGTPDIPIVRKDDSPTYSLKIQQNLVRYGEPIPVVYGKVRWFPDLACLPYTKYVDGVKVTRQVFCLGQGDFELNDIKIGESSVINLDALSYTLYNPNEAMVAFEDNVKTHPDVSNIVIRSASRVQRRFTTSPATVTLNKTSKTITFSTSTGRFSEFLSVDDLFYIDSFNTTSDTVSGTIGEYQVVSVTDTVITVSDSSGWSGNGNMVSPFFTLSESHELNPFSSIKRSSNPSTFSFYVKESSTGEIKLANPLSESYIIELDFNFDEGYYYINSITGNRGLKPPVENLEAYHVPVDSEGVDIDTHYLVYTGVIVLSFVSGNTYQASSSYRDWKNSDDLTGVNFPTVTDYTLEFTLNYAPIDASDIQSIDYVNGSVTFVTPKVGVVRVANVVLEITESTETQSNLRGYHISSTSGKFPGLTGISSVKLSNFNLSVSISPFIWDNFEMQIFENYRFMFFSGYANSVLGADISQVYDKMIITSLKQVFPNVENYPNVSLLATEFSESGSSVLSDEKNLNVTTTRKLKIWNGSSWAAPVASRSIAWALADIYMSTYGGNKTYFSLDLAKLITLETTWSSRGDTFDGVFDSPMTVLEALRMVARVGRVTIDFEDISGNLTFIRDEAKTTHISSFGPHNIVAGTFKMRYSFPDSFTPDAVKIKYLDEDNGYKPSEVISQTTSYLTRDIDLFGCVNYEQAWREAVFRDAKMKTNFITVTFQTELFGNNVFLGDFVSIQMDLPNWGQGGLIVDKSGTTLTSNQPLDWSGSAPFYISFVKPTGTVSGHHLVTQGADDYTLILDSDVTSFTFITARSNQQLTAFNFGPSTNYQQSCVISSAIKSKSNNRVTITCTPYVASVYTADNGTVPTKPSTSASTTVIPGKVSGLYLTNVPGSGDIVANWNPAETVDNYKVQSSTDGVTFSDVSTPSVTTETISTTGLLYVRVAVVLDSVIGEYTRQSIVAS